MIIPFEEEYRARYYALLDEVFDSNFWSEGNMQRRFESCFGEYVKLGARAVSNGGAGILAILDYLDVRGKEVLLPDNTFWATAQAVYKAGGTPVYVDCNRDDLCMSFNDLSTKVTDNTAAVIVVHIGGHIAFEINEIARFCSERGIPLVEDCAHVHGGWWNGKTGGHYGFAGSYSFYATKTMPLGDAGMVVSRDEDFLCWLEQYRNYGKRLVDGKVTYPLKNGFNYRINEFTAALGILQTERLPKIIEWKRELAKKYDEIFETRVRFPDGMESGYYKYIVFGCPELREQTGKVFGPGDLCTAVEGRISLPNSRWVAENHFCAPIFYGWEHAELQAGKLRELLLP